MEYFYAFLLFLHLAETLKGEPEFAPISTATLEITKTVNGIETPLTDDHTIDIEANTDTNLTLTCKLVGISAYYYDDKLSWGWKRKNVHFDDVHDLNMLSKDDLQPLKQFVQKTEFYNEARKDFFPLLPADKGEYFCMSLKYSLFKVVKLNVSDTSFYDLLVSLRGLDKMLSNDTFVFTKSECNADMFMCNSGDSCIRNENVCDGVQDCDDYSDENRYLCGDDRCADKSFCDERCIAESDCCNLNISANCVPSSCCTEILKKKRHDKYDQDEPIKYNQKFMEDLFHPIKDIDFEQFDKLLTETPKIDISKMNINDIKWDSIWKPYKRHEKKIDWIVFSYSILAFLVFWLLIISCLILCRFVLKRRNRAGGNLLNIARVTILIPRSPNPSNPVVQEETENKDLPPSYDEAVVNVPQNTPLL